ncbi:MAG: hypothetical protein HY268_18335, partial [Deltaproteobacteria bacterium]|nr:hypothetical protein [Deltaproteobacteria bacterium]
GRLWPRQGKKGEPQPVLSETYNWFTEGCDTKDWQTAQALRKELV